MKKLIMALLLMPMMALATTWYVNGSTGSDFNSGVSESSAKATIQASIDASSAGDTILVAPGIYAPITSASKVLSIRSTQGALVTIIDGHVGGATKRCVHLADASGSFGPPEESSGAYDSLFEGFTIRNGRAEDDYGGGIRGGTVRNCIIEFCASSGAGGAYGCKLYQCIVRNNIAGDDGGGLHSCIAYDTLIVGNEAHNSWGGKAGAAASCSKLYNCTITKNISTGSSVAALDYYISAYNCIVWGNTKTGGGSADVLYASTYNCYTADPSFVDAANGDYRLAAGSSCIDAGDNSYVTTMADLAGNARIANGTVDLGCYEYGSSSGVNITDGLVAYYPFDGNANDASGNGHSLNSSDAGVTLTFDRNGNANSAYFFDGTGTCYPNSTWKFEGSGTYSFWVKPEELIGEFYPEEETWSTGLAPYVIFPLWGSGPVEGYPSSGVVGIGMSVGRNGIMVHEHAHCYLSTTLSCPVELGSDWVNVVVTIEDKGAPKLFLNGELVRTGITTEYRKVFGLSPQIPVGHEPLDGASGQDGVGGGCYGHFKGALDDLRIYNRALSAAEVKALYDGTPVTPPAPVTYTVTFDLNGAEGDAPTERQVAEGAVIGTLPTPTREGYEFLGWHVGKEASSEEVTAPTIVTADMTVYAVWRINSYTVAFDANGGTGSTTMTQDYGTALTAPTVTRTGYTFTGWSPEVAATVPASDVTYIAQWLVNSYTVTFDANGGTGGRTVTQDYGTALTAPTVTRTGYTFTGWSPAVPSTVPAADATYAAQWRINSYTVTFDAQGGAGGGTVARNHGAALGELPVPTRDGFSFDGWFTAASGGTEVSSATVITGAVMFYAHWTEQSLYQTPVWYDEDGEEIDWTQYYDGDEEPFAAESAATFDGYVLDGEEVCGLVQVKVGKANKKTETAKVTAALTLLGEAKKRSYKGTMSKRGVAELTCNGRGNLSLCLGTNAMWGEVDGLSVNGSRNVFAKAGDPKAAALARWQGTYALVLETVDAEGAGSAFAWGYSGLTVTVGAKGKVKVQGTMVDGSKVNVTSQLLVGEKRSCIPVVVPLYSKQGGFGFNLWLQEDGTVEAGEMGAWDATASKTPFLAWFGEIVPTARAGAALPGTLSFLFMGEPDLAEMEVLYDFVPWEVSVATGTKWTLPAAGSVKYDREAEEYVDAKDSSNPAGLKLTYVAKTGAFKGSFKLYATDSAGRLKKLTANVSGVMVGRQGYGTATVKGIGSWPVAIE